jgi:hypothetical protein
MTHQLIGDVIDAFGRHLQQVRITEVRGHIFYAELILDRNTRVSARVSDAIALALHLGAPIHAEDTVLDAAASRPHRSPHGGRRRRSGRRGRAVPPVPRHHIPRGLRPGLILGLTDPLVPTFPNPHRAGFWEDSR